MNPRFRALLAAALILVALPVLAGCGSAWREVPLGSIDSSAPQLGEFARFTLNDERVIEMRIVEIKYPYVEGHRTMGLWSTERKLRLDLREVARVEVRKAS